MDFDGQVLIQLLTCVVTFILVVITAWYAFHTRNMARTMARQTEGDLLLRLNELYAQLEISKAIHFIHEAKRNLWEDFPEKRYHFGEQFCKAYLLGAPDGVDNRLRWHLVNFWYTLAVLVEKSIIDKETIFRRFGPPEVIDILEPIEAVLAYQILLKADPDADPKLVKREVWPPWGLFASWKGKKGKRNQFPACWSEFKVWADTYKNKQPEDPSKIFF